MYPASSLLHEGSPLMHARRSSCLSIAELDTGMSTSSKGYGRFGQPKTAESRGLSLRPVEALPHRAGPHPGGNRPSLGIAARMNQDSLVCGNKKSRYRGCKYRCGPMRWIAQPPRTGYANQVNFKLCATLLSFTLAVWICRSDSLLVAGRYYCASSLPVFMNLECWKPRARIVARSSGVGLKNKKISQGVT
ncbi:hypothetical protein OE88DRAFT_1541237 [Heliocybe sulcata]|uniref:Uncharacterized protein n=1 Tax=Heliocybe sulcata TaxID=5364 RepID=A0A5C3N174_9AGAM|nr:hypothetical protein OE88DRAFT_1541237 [Heliocybe sulcata]